MDTLHYSALLLKKATHSVSDVAFLLERGADPNYRDENLGTPMHRALSQYPHKNGVNKILKLLMAKGARLDIENVRCESLIHLAVTYYHEDSLKLLLQNGAKKDTQDINLKTPLHIAAKQHGLALEILLAAGANPNIQDLNSDTPLHIAVSHHPAAVPVLLEKGANPNIKNKQGKTSLYIAAYYGDTNLMRRFLKYKAIPTLTNNDLETPLHRAGWWSHSVEDTIMLLLEARAKINARDRNFDTPLHFAILSFHASEDAINILLAQGANPNASNRKHQTPLHYAVMHNLPNVVELLLKKGALFNAEDIYHKTPFHYSAQSGRDFVAKLLAEKAIEVGNSKLFLNAPRFSSNSLFQKQNRLALLWELMLKEKEKQIFYMLYLLKHGKLLASPGGVRSKHLQTFQWIWGNNLPIEVTSLICTFLFEESIECAKTIFSQYNLVENLDRDALKGLFTLLLEKQSRLFWLNKTLDARQKSNLSLVKEFGVRAFQQTGLYFFSIETMTHLSESISSIYPFKQSLSHR